MLGQSCPRMTIRRWGPQISLNAEWRMTVNRLRIDSPRGRRSFGHHIRGGAQSEPQDGNGVPTSSSSMHGNGLRPAALN
jgi:hypothetical protein